MKVILLEDVKKQGFAGDVIEVSQGYGQNFLIKTKKAILATEENLLDLENKKEKDKEKRQLEIEKAKEVAKKLIKFDFVFSVKANNGKLYGTFSKKELAKNLSSVSNYKFDAHKIKLNIAKIEHIGTFEVKYEIVKKVSVKFNVKIIEE